MTLREILGRLAAWRNREELEGDLAADLDAHVELLARDMEQDGMSPADAQAAARRQVGNVTALREQSRDYWGFPLVESLLQDVRYAWRGLRRSPGFTATVVVTLGLGIGANAAMFVVIDGLMFRPFPYLREPGDVHRVYLEATSRGRTSADPVFAYRRYQDLAAATHTVAAFAGHTEWRFAVGRGDESRVRKVAGVTPSFFDFFDAPPALGRYFYPAEDLPPGGTRVAVISHALWREAFGSANVIGRPLKVGTIDYTIVGVAPQGFVGTTPGYPPEVFVPLTAIPAHLGAWSMESYTRAYGWDWVLALVRRRQGMSAAAVSAELSEAYVRSRASARALNPRVLPDSIARPRAIAGPVKQAAGPDAGREPQVLLWVAGVAAIVLLIACANVANLMLARVLRRRREITLRLALGVSRRRLIFQFLVEGLLLASIGSIAGLLAAQWGGAAIRTLVLPGGSSFNVATDWRTLTAALACAALAILLTTLGPALFAARTDLAATLKAGAREGGYQKSRARVALLVLQGALSVVLLVGAGLFVRSFVNATSVPLGYDARPVIEVIPDFRGFAMDGAEGALARRRILEAAQELPGVASAARVNSGLFRTNTANLSVAGIDSLEALGRFNMQIVSPDYFDVLQIRVLQGRGITDDDRPGSPLVVVVSEAMARAVWPGRNPIGQCLRIALGNARPTAETPCTTVVGVANNTAQQDIAGDPRFMYYLPVEQAAPEVSTLLLRMSAADARGELERVRRELTRAMPGDGFVFVRPLQEVVDDQSRSWRLGATLFVAFGGLALVVAIVGLYGVISYNVAQRRHELGVRVALGARAGDVVLLVVGQGFRFGLGGVVLGLALALVAARWVQPLLFRQSATDPATYALVGAAMLLAALAASAIPAWRASRADPNQALRSD